MTHWVTEPHTAYSPENIILQHLASQRRVLIFGQAGVGKSTLAIQLTLQLLKQGRDVCLLDADPGSPTFGIPGAISLIEPSLISANTGAESGQPSGVQWQVTDFEALCTLDAARFRLPLASAVSRLLRRHPLEQKTLIIDAPGVTRGVAGAELLQALMAAGAADLLLVLVAKDKPVPLANELASCQAELVLIQAHEKVPAKQVLSRKQVRTAEWLAYMQGGCSHSLLLDDMLLLGTPPPISAPKAWMGRQLALLNRERTLVMGQVVNLVGKRLQILIPFYHLENPSQLLIRDALHSSQLGLHSAQPFRPLSQTVNPALQATQSMEIQLPLDHKSPPIARRMGVADATLVNGVFGDPLLLLRLRYQKRSLLFDLGDHGGLPARIAHQVSDVFISHTHMDHITGFLWLLRSRIGYYPSCRLFGPPGLAQNIAGLISGILWDRIEDRGPRFDIFELHGKQLRHWQITSGQPLGDELAAQEISDGIIWREHSFKVRAVTLDHRQDSQGPNQQPAIPVLAFAFEPNSQLRVRKDQLQALGLVPGPWLMQLKQQVLKGEMDAVLQVNQRRHNVASLADAILIKQPGQKLVYATDFSDTVENHHKITSLAKHAHSLFCEASFVNADMKLATHTGHLTTQACGQIGKDAMVENLLPFHFSRRYQGHPQLSYQEVSRACEHTVRVA